MNYRKRKQENNAVQNYIENKKIPGKKLNQGGETPILWQL